MNEPIMLFIRKYRRHRWEYKIVYIDPFTKKTRAKRKNGFRTKIAAEIEAAEIIGYICSCRVTNGGNLY